MDFGRLQTLYKHQGAELKSLKAALEQRDAQVEEFETQLQREHVEASNSVSSFQQQIASLKGRHLHGFVACQRWKNTCLACFTLLL